MVIIDNLLPNVVFVGNQDIVATYGINGMEDKKKAQHIHRPKDLTVTCCSSTTFNIGVMLLCILLIELLLI